MDINKLISLRPYLYHLTDQANVGSIQNMGRILAANNVIDLSDLADKNAAKTCHRTSHLELTIEGVRTLIRDQKPLNKSLEKCLTNGWTREDYVHYLNSRVFTWLQLKHLQSHFSRYEQENPAIFRFVTEDLLAINNNVELCRLNSGAPRPSSHLGGVPPPRGQETFLSPDKYNLTPGTVHEVTFVGHCVLPKSYNIGYHPDGPWQKV